jgi:hypothetical protein
MSMRVRMVWRRLWALGRVEVVRHTQKGSPYLLSFFQQHASRKVGSISCDLSSCTKIAAQVGACACVS